MPFERTNGGPASTYSSSYFFTSSAAAGATNVSADGTQFSLVLTNPIAIPPDAVAVELGVLSASIWNNSPNIGPGLGPGLVDDYKFRYTTSLAPAGTYDINFPTGLYSLAALSSFLSTQFVNNGHPANLFTLSGAAATGLAYITILTAGDVAHFEQVGSVGVILGFPAAAVTAASANHTVFGSSVAMLNRNNTYLIFTDLIPGGIPTNSSAAGLIASVPITAPPGSIVNWEPTNVLWTPAQALAGGRRSNISFRLTNERSEATPTAGESWAFTVQIRFRR